MNDDIAALSDEIIELLDRERVGRRQRENEGGEFMNGRYVVAGGFESPEVYDGVTLPAEEASDAVFRLHIAAPDAEEGATVAVELPMTQESIDLFAQEHDGQPISSFMIVNMESGIPQIAGSQFGSMDNFVLLNGIAQAYTRMSVTERMTFKAALQAQNGVSGDLSDVLETAESISEYELAAFVSDEAEFFKEYIAHSLPTDFDVRWLDTLAISTDSLHLLERLGATVTDYGILSARGESLYKSIPFSAPDADEAETQEQTEDNSDLSEDSADISVDIKACFDSFDHHVLVNAIRERIADEYFIALIWKFLKAGYMEQWTYHKTYSGTPQGSGISPILANIYLDNLDRFIEEYKSSFDRGEKNKRKVNSGYVRARENRNRLETDYKTRRHEVNEETRLQMKRDIRNAQADMFRNPYYAACDEGYKRMYYCRYADDFIISVIGSKQDAVRMKEAIGQFLADKLKLTLSEEKTKITHTSDFARFLGYDICISHSKSLKYDRNGVAKREYSGRIMMYVPREKWEGKLKDYQAFRIDKDENGKEKWRSLHRGKLINCTDIDIITKYNSEIRGLYNYYRLAHNVSVLNKFAFIMEYSMYKTFACKYRSTISKMIDKYSINGVFSVPYDTKAGRKYCEFYHDGFKRVKQTLISVDTLPEYSKKYENPNSNAARLKRGICELCGLKTDNIYMYHVRRLKDLTGDNPWEVIMRGKRRKSLAVCKSCFDVIHDSDD